MFDWRELKKYDAHVHLLPPYTLGLMKEEQPDRWGHADPAVYPKIMEAYNIQKAVLVPTNDGGTYFFDAGETNKWLGQMGRESGGKYLPFAEVLNTGGYFYKMAPWWLEQAVKEEGLLGLKLHPSNLGIPMDSLEMVPVIRAAADLKVPIMVHSYPYGSQNYTACAPDRIHTMARIFPDATFIISHMGGYRWQDALGGREYVDLSAFLPELVSLYGMEQANRILRAFGPERLLFATDYPDVYQCCPDNVYDRYCEILNQMDFSQEEAELIAYGNLEKILNL